jgi:hypothetical protein
VLLEIRCDVAANGCLLKPEIADLFLEDDAQEAYNDCCRQHIDGGLRAPRPSPGLPVALSAERDELPIGRRQVLCPLGKPGLCQRELEAHQQRVGLGVRRLSLPGAAVSFEHTLPDQEVLLLRNPFFELLPPSEYRFVRNLGIRLAVTAFRRRRHQQPAGVVGQLRDQLPLLVRELGTQRTPPRRLAVLAHGRKPQRQHALQRFFGRGMRREESIDALDQYTAEVKGFSA